VAQEVFQDVQHLCHLRKEKHSMTTFFQFWKQLQHIGQSVKKLGITNEEELKVHYHYNLSKRVQPSQEAEVSQMH
jgi:hypothetical protein